MTTTRSGRWRTAGHRGVTMILGALAAVAVGGCSDILEVQDPDIVDPDGLDNPAGLEARRIGAFGDFALAFAGAPVGGGGAEGHVLITGLLADEFQLSGTFPTRIEIDARKIQDDNSSLSQYFNLQHLARRAAETSVDAYEATDAIDAADKEGPLAELNNLAGFSYVFFAESFCSGVPFSEVLPDGSLEYGQPLPTDAMFAAALGRFDAALAHAQADGDIDLEYLARVGQGRVLLGLGRYDEAATAVQSVPSGWSYDIRHSSNSDRQKNGVYSMNVENERWTLSNIEGLNGLAYRDAYTNGDPRTPWQRIDDDVGFDTAIPQFDQMKYPAEDSDLPLASGVEARLIEAEAALQSGDVAGFDAIHSALRVPEGLGMIDTSALTLDERVDLHFEERGYWLWLTGHRLGDMRRLVRQYGRDAETVFPTGAYFKVQAGDFGPDVNLPVPFDEENNPNFESCIDRGA